MKNDFFFKLTTPANVKKAWREMLEKMPVGREHNLK